MSWSPGLRRALKVFSLGCLLPSLVLGVSLLVWAVRATRAAAERLGRAGGAAPAATEVGGLVPVQGLPPVPRESVMAAIPVLESLARLWGKDSPGVGRLLGFLAHLHGSIGELDRAQLLYEEAFAILHGQPAGREDLGWLSNNMGMTYLHQGRVGAAAEHFRLALGALPPERSPAERAIALQNMASASTLLGEWERADAAYREALSLLERLGSGQARAHLITRHNLAALRLTIGDSEGAKAICEELLAAGEALPTTLRLATLNDLAEALRGLGRHREAEERLMQAAALAEKGSAAEAKVVANLAVLQFELGDLDQARAFSSQALSNLEGLAGSRPEERVGPFSTLAMVALAEQDLGKAEALLRRAQSLWEAGGPADHPFVASVNKGLAVIAQRQGDAPRAKALALEALALDRQDLRKILSFGSEAQRLAYRGQTFPYDLLANLGEPRSLAEAVLSMKGAVSDSLQRERAVARHATRPEDRGRLARIASLKRQILAEIAAGAANSQAGAPAAASRQAALRRELEAEESALARSLGRPGLDFAFEVAPEAVQARLAPREALVELVRFERFEGSPKLVAHYGALVVPARGEPRWVTIGPAREIESLLEELSGCLWQRSRGVEVPGDCGSPSAFEAELRTLSRRLWEPISRILPQGTRSVVLSPDGALHFVPWAALPDAEGRFLAESTRVTQVTSGRDLLRGPRGAGTRTVLALGRNEGGLVLPESEAQFVAELAAAHGWATKTLIGEQATEAQLFLEPSPGILHLATHGYFLRGTALRDVPAGFASLPMLRGYVELAGARETLVAWKAGGPSRPEDDGLLTAEEVAGLDLSQTWLVVLSACETGLGEARPGEGVLGLRHGFRIAGAEHLLFSLWKVEDQEIHSFMQRFYPRLLETSDPVRAFAEVQREELLRLRSEASFGAAVLGAGGLVLTR